MKLYAIKTKIIKFGDNLVDTILKSLKEQQIKLENNDILAITSKIIANLEGRVVKLNDVTPSAKGQEFAQLFSLQPEFAELILLEADDVYGGVKQYVLTRKEGLLTANSGIDKKNAPVGSVILWPKTPANWAQKIKVELRHKTGKNVAVLIVDSGLTPLKLGTTGLALATVGFKPVKDLRGNNDLFGKTIVVTHHAVADDLAAAAHLMMGEAAEKTPVVLIKNAPVDFDSGLYGATEMRIPVNECIFMRTFFQFA